MSEQPIIAREISQQYGITIDQIRDPEWDQVMTAGVTAKLHVGRWRGKAKRTLADLGIQLEDAEERDAWTNVLDDKDLGTAKLLPLEQLKQLNSTEQSARAMLISRSIGTPWGRWIPVARLQDWLEWDRKYKTEYYRITRDIEDNYDRYRDIVWQAYYDAGCGIYRRQNGLAPGQYVPVSWRQDFADTKIRGFPMLEEFKRSVYWSTEYSFLTTPSAIGEQIAERERLITSAQLDARDRELLMSLNGEIQERFAAKKRQIDEFTAAISAEIRARVLQVCKDTLAAMNRNSKGRIASKTLESLRDLRESLGTLNILNDQEIETQLNRISDLAGSYNAQNANLITDQIRQALTEIQTSARTVIEQIEVIRTPRREDWGDDVLAQQSTLINVLTAERVAEPDEPIEHFDNEPRPSPRAVEPDEWGFPDDEPRGR